MSEELRATEISDAMAKADRPADAFQPMPMATPEPPKEKPFSGEVEGIRAAADELTKRRQDGQAPVIERGYQDAKTRERRPLNETRKLSEAAADLEMARTYEHHAMQEFDNSNLRERIDQYRAEQDAQEVLAAHYARKEAEQSALEGDAVPEPQPTGEATPPPATSLTEKLARLDPELRGAIEQQATAHENARQQHLQSAETLAKSAWANILAQFPELQQGNVDQVLEQMRTSNPMRFAEISGHLQKVQQIGQHWQQLRAQQQQQEAQRFQQYSTQADNEFEDFKNSRPPSEAKAVMSRVMDFATRELGVDEKTLMQLWATNPIIRSPQMQKMLYMATAHALAQERAAAIRPTPNLPKVMRPGVSSDHVSGESVVVANKMREFANAPTAKNAGAALAARRRAAALNRR